jgi:hypothetical protein
MKLHYALLGLLAIPTLASAAVTMPDGTLGVNSVSLYGIYENYEFQYDGTDTDLTGVGVGTSRNLFNGQDYGCDAGFTFEFLKSTDDFYGSYTGRTYIGNVTVYKKGAISPFFSAICQYENEGWSGYDHEDAMYFGGEIGVECHLAPRWYVTPKFKYITTTNAEEFYEDEDHLEIYSVTTGYWVTDQIDMFADVSYCDYYGDHAVIAKVGAIFQY